MSITMSTVKLERKKEDPGASLAFQYGGNYAGGWVSYLPKSWLPFIQLARLNPPAGCALVYFPHLFGALYASILLQRPLAETIQTCGLLMCGSLFFSNAAHTWNDIVDAQIDAQVERTRKRPIPRKAVTRQAAFVFTVTQAAAALVFFSWFPFPRSALYAIPSILGSTYYPWAKRHTNIPQLVLGFCLSWGTFIGALAAGMKPFAYGEYGPPASYGLTCMFLAAVLWTMIYDTIYAHQDVKDDIKVGIGSLAVHFKDRTKFVLWVFLAFMACLLSLSGIMVGLSWGFYLFAVGGPVVSLGLMVASVDLSSSADCWWWFGNGFWYVGCSIGAGLLFEYGRTLII